MTEQVKQGTEIQNSADAKVIGILKSTGGGNVTAIAADGSSRELKAGDKIFDGETLKVSATAQIVATDANGEVIQTESISQAVVSFVDGSSRHLPAGETVLSDEVYQQFALLEPEEDEEAGAEFAELLAALESGEDISELLDATAAGAGEGDADGDESGQGVRFERVDQAVSPTVGIDPDIGFTTVDADASFVQQSIDDEDDTPDPEPDVITLIPEDGLVVESGETFGDSVITNDMFGDDGPGNPPVVAVNGDPANVGQPVQGSLGGTIIIDENGDYTYTPPEQVDHSDDVPDSETFEYTIQDGNGTQASTTVTIVIEDTEPEAFDDAASTQEDTPVTVNVFANDQENADAASVTSIVNSTGAGVVELLDGENIKYSPAPGEEGQVTITYEITDADGDTDQADLVITVGEDSVPSIEGADALVDETGGFDSDTQNLTFSFGNDTGSIALSAAGATWDGVDTLTADNGTWEIVVNNDSTYTFTQLAVVSHSDNTDPNDPFTVTVTATATDDEPAADQASTQFTVTVLDDGPSVDVFTNEFEGEEEQFDESSIVLQTDDALTIGANSDADSTSQDFSGLFGVTSSFGTDGAGSITVSYGLNIVGGPDSGLTSGGDAITLVDNSGVVEGRLADNTVVFSIAVDNDGVVTLTQNEVIDHIEGTSEDSVISLVNGLVELTATGLITDADGDTAQDSETIDLGGNISFVDDNPLANDDGPAGVTEDGTSFVSGNVLDNDDANADQPKSFVEWDAGNAAAIADLETYGSLTLNNDGTWDYTLDNTDPDTQALNAGDFISKELTYTMQDADGDTDTATLTITITGANDGATVDTGEGETVFEAGLPDGSANDDSDLIISGAFDVSATDGIDTVTIGGEVFTYAELAAFDGSDTVNTGQGIITLKSFSGDQFGGTITYDYELSAAIENDTATPTLPETVDGDSYLDVVAIEIDGVGGTNGGDNLEINILDDGPSISVNAVAAADALTVDESDLTTDATANYADNFSNSFDYGADDAGSVSSAYALSISAEDADTGLVDVATDEAILLTLNGGVVEGRTETSDDLVFTVSVNGSGTVELDQVRAIKHPNAADPDDSVTLDAANLVTLTRTDTITDKDGDSTDNSASIDIGTALNFKDDGPAEIDPEISFIINDPSMAAGDAADVALDTDSNVDDNYGADEGGSVTFTNIAVNGTDSGQSSGGNTIYLYTNGTILIGSTLGASDFATVLADVEGVNANGVFQITLDPDSDVALTQDDYDAELFKQVDGAVQTFDTSNGDYDFQGGNTNYFYYFDQTGVNPDVLLTPLGTDGTKINGNANEAGVNGGGGGQDVGSGEGIRVNFVDGVAGTPQQTDYVSPADHTFTENVTVNGAFATLRSQGNSDSNIAVRAYDDAGGNSNVTDGTPDDITKIVIGGVEFTGSASSGGYDVFFDDDGSVLVNNVPDNTQIQVFTDDGLTSIEIDYVSGNTFSLGGFGATVPVPGQQINMAFDLEVEDADGDSVVVSDALKLAISPDDHVLIEGTSGNDAGGSSLDATLDQAATLIGLAGNDELNGNNLNDILIGGQGSDTMSGGGESDLFVWYAGDETGAPTDTITDFSLSEGDILNFSDLLQGEGPNADGAELNSYLNFAYDNVSGDTTITVDVDGVGGDTDVSIVIQDENLVGGAGTNVEVIDNLIASSNLVTD